MQIVRVSWCVMLTVIATPTPKYIDARCLTPGCNGKRLSMRRCVRHAESLMRRLKRNEARKLFEAKPSPQNGRIRTKTPVAVGRALHENPGSTVAELAKLSNVAKGKASSNRNGMVRAALRALIAVGEARRERGEGQVFVYFPVAMPQGGCMVTKSHAAIFRELREHPGSTVADLVMRSEFSRATVKRALSALIAVGDARREPGSGRALVYFLAGVL